MEACLDEELPPTTELEEGLRNGVYLAKLGNFFAPHTVSLKKIYDREQTRYKVQTYRDRIASASDNLQAKKHVFSGFVSKICSSSESICVLISADLVLTVGSSLLGHRSPFQTHRQCDPVAQRHGGQGPAQGEQPASADQPPSPGSSVHTRSSSDGIFTPALQPLPRETHRRWFE